MTIRRIGILAVVLLAAFAAALLLRSVSMPGCDGNQAPKRKITEHRHGRSRVPSRPADVRHRAEARPDHVDADSTTTATYRLRWQRESRTCGLPGASDLLPQARTARFDGALTLSLCDRRGDEMLWTARLRATAAAGPDAVIRLRTRADGTWLGVAAGDTTVDTAARAEDVDDVAAALAILRCVPLAMPMGQTWRTRQQFPIGSVEVAWSSTTAASGERTVWRRYGEWRPRSVTPLHVAATGEARATWGGAATSDRTSSPFFTRAVVDESRHVEHPYLGIAADQHVVASLERADADSCAPAPGATWDAEWRDLLQTEVERPWQVELLPIPLDAVLAAVACAQARNDPLDPRLAQVARLLPELLWQVPTRIDEAAARLLAPPVDLGVADLLARALTRAGDERCQQVLLPVLERAAVAVRRAVIACSDELTTPTPAWIAQLQTVAHGDDDEAATTAWLALASLARRAGAQQMAVAEAAWAALTSTTAIPRRRVAAWQHALAASGRPEAAAMAALATPR